MLTMCPLVGVKVPLIGSNISAASPPVKSTLPSFNTVAVCTSVVPVIAVEVNVSFFGSNNSESAVPPPMTNTLPSFNNVAVWL